MQNYNEKPYRNMGKGEAVLSAEAQSLENNDDIARRLGMSYRTFNDCVEAGSMLPDPVDLYDGLWFEGELTALYADTNLGKSIFAVQIGEQVARKGFKTMYVDIELSDKGIEKRARHDDGTLHRFPDNFMRLTINFSEILKDANLDEDGLDVLDRIELVARQNGVRAIIIDNLTALCAGMESGDTAVRLVNRLLQMRSDNGLSILFLCHTPKLDRTQPLTRDSMGGSKRIISLIDSAFCIGQVLSDPTLRYVKQTKVRMDEYRYHDNNVLVCGIERVDGLLQFVGIGNEREINLLESPSKKSKRADRNAKIKELSKVGYSVRDIAAMLGISAGAVQYALKKAE